jgi:8-oxo-dGTP pyrophosphatase MutT (NUDIX family)
MRKKNAMGAQNWGTKCWVTTVYLVRKDGRVLLTFNNTLKTWIPVGGHVDFGETPEEAVKREVEEETGFEFQFVPEATEESEGRVHVLHPQRVQVEAVPHHGHHINTVFYGLCTSWSDRSHTDENERLRWFTLDELNAERSTLIENVYKSAVDAIKTVTKNPS